MSTAIATKDQAGQIEQVLLDGDLSQLTPKQRLDYYHHVCQSLNLNPLTKPFDYLRLNGKMILYARKDCTEQLRKRDKVSVKLVDKQFAGDLYIVTANATLPDGRCDESVGAVNLKGLGGEGLANAIMKCETKAKRRVTLSICGLGFLDETEVETIQGATVAEPEQPKQINGKLDTQPEPSPEKIKEWQDHIEWLRTQEKSKPIPTFNAALKALLAEPAMLDKVRELFWAAAKHRNLTYDTVKKSFKARPQEQEQPA